MFSLGTFKGKLLPEDVDIRVLRDNYFVPWFENQDFPLSANIHKVVHRMIVENVTRKLVDHIHLSAERKGK